MNEPFNIAGEMLSKVTETEDAFIFQTLSDFAQTHYQIIVEKDELIKAIQLIRMMREGLIFLNPGLPLLSNQQFWEMLISAGLMMDTNESVLN